MPLFRRIVLEVARRVGMGAKAPWLPRLVVAAVQHLHIVIRRPGQACKQGLKIGGRDTHQNRNAFLHGATSRGVVRRATNTPTSIQKITLEMKPTAVSQASKNTLPRPPTRQADSVRVSQNCFDDGETRLRNSSRPVEAINSQAKGS